MNKHLGSLFVWILEPRHTHLWMEPSLWRKSETMGGRGQESWPHGLTWETGPWRGWWQWKVLTRDQLVEVVSHHHTGTRCVSHLLHNQERLYHWSLGKDTGMLTEAAFEGLFLGLIVLCSSFTYVCYQIQAWEHLNLGLPVFKDSDRENHIHEQDNDVYSEN